MTSLMPSMYIEERMDLEQHSEAHHKHLHAVDLTLYNKRIICA